MIRHLGALIATTVGLWLTPSSALGQSTQTWDALPVRQTQPELAIRVGTKELPPFISIEPSASPYGYSADLWQTIADDLALQTEWVTYPSVSDLLTGLENGEVDVAIAGISITAQREAAGFDFSYPFYQSGLQLMVPKPETTAITLTSSMLNWHNLRPIFLIFASSTLVGGLIWLVEHKHNEHFSGNPIRGVSQGIWFAIVTLGTFGYGDVTPTKFTGRFIATLWMGLSFFIVADFIASLTVHQLSENQLNLEALGGQSVGALEGTTGEIFLQSQPVKLITYPTFEAAVAALENGEIKGLVQDAPALRHFINLNPGYFELAGDLLTNEGYGIAVRENDANLLEAVDQLILEYQQQGFLQQLHHKWFNEVGVLAD
ncbi:amino acid abc transporter substrate-binding paat family [Leptolyngbya sp. Heron Island J]|uniref:transporter substrate-binding domain-containing protein n=1 Tax=Leptolyngbya sp. Heron Island J TaxID=1385935 RepID=UPI0003B9E056|nr:transporter substrate-binding domain-containing protein [Leptolyngbya sp. Heron Island J]ESA35280.1 amino acid abc transporter substrate-binding paat family [Leptolyngbya sp. Heron Island J]